MRQQEWCRQINDDGDVILRGESGIAVNMRGDVDLADKIVNSVRYHDRLVEALGWALEWIDAIPSDIELPVMPGFDRDYVNGLLDELSAHNGGEG